MPPPRQPVMIVAERPGDPARWRSLSALSRKQAAEAD